MPFAGKRFRASALISVAVVLLTAALAAPTHALAATRPTGPTLSAPGTFVAVGPSRVLDTRAGTGAPRQPVPAHGTVSFSVVGVGGVPASGVGGVVLNLVVTRPGSAGYATAYAQGTTRPATSTINFAAGQTVAHEAVVQPGSDGRAIVYNGSAAPIDLVADVSGYLTAGVPTAGGAIGTVLPARLVDTRSGVGAPRAPLKNNSQLRFSVLGRDGIPASGVSAVLLNLTVTRADAAGYLIAASWRISALNFASGQAVSNFAVVPLDADGKVTVTPEFGAVHSATLAFVADVVGWVHAGDPTAAGELQPFAPTRLLDTRASGRAAIPAGGSITQQVAGVGGIPAHGVTAAALNIAVVAPASSGYLTVYPDGTSQPGASTLNFARTTLANDTIVPVGADGSVVLFNGSTKPLDLVVDSSAFVAPITAPFSWSARTQITPNPVNTVNGVNDSPRFLTCPTSTYCAAVDTLAPKDILTYNGSAWSAPEPALADVGDTLDCPVANTCFAITGTSHDDGGTGMQIERSTGHGWAQLDGIGGSAYELDSLSCVSATFCAAGGFDSAGDDSGPSVWTWNGTTWARFDLVGDALAPPSVSCVSAGFCVVVDGDSAVWNGSTWTMNPAVFDSTVQRGCRMYLDDVLSRIRRYAVTSLQRCRMVRTRRAAVQLLGRAGLLRRRSLPRDRITRRGERGSGHRTSRQPRGRPRLVRRRLERPGCRRSSR